MPEGRKFPYKYIPRFGAKVTVTIGAPIPHERIWNVLNSSSLSSSVDGADEKRSEDPERAREVERIRSQVTDVLQREVEALGRSVILRRDGKLEV